MCRTTRSPSAYPPLSGPGWPQMPEIPDSRKLLGVVAIGRNEGGRLNSCLRSVAHLAGAVVYVDSGSTDGSAALARALGITVVALDLHLPFPAGRARNAGFQHLR